MTLAIDDPLIARMTIDTPLPLHESSRRLRELEPECPRVYGVAVMGDLSRRRWWPLSDALVAGRLRGMFDAAVAEAGNRVAVTQQLAATLAHVVVGRVVPLLVLEGRAWDTGLENLWVHVDSEGVVDWVGVVDPTLRALPDDADLHAGAGIVALPSEAALTTWVAHRSHCALRPLFEELAAVSSGAVSTDAMWHVVGTAVVSAATRVPLLASCSEVTSMRRGQAVLDALVGFGAPVRGVRRASTKALLN